MRQNGRIAGLLLVGMLALVGCQSAGVDAIETTSLGARAGAPGMTELASGKAHFRAANYGLAEKHFRKAVELSSGNAEAWMGLAAAYDQLGRFDFADRAYEQLVRLAGRRAEVVNNMGYSQYLRGNEAKARALYAEARAVTSDTTLVDANLALLDS